MQTELSSVAMPGFRVATCTNKYTAGPPITIYDMVLDQLNIIGGWNKWERYSLMVLQNPFHISQEALVGLITLRDTSKFESVEDVLKDDSFVFRDKQHLDGSTEILEEPFKGGYEMPLRSRETIGDKVYDLYLKNLPSSDQNKKYPRKLLGVATTFAKEGNHQIASFFTREYSLVAYTPMS